MKIGILTLPLHTNYGGILQAYALQTVLEGMGHEVTIIDEPIRKSKRPPMRTYVKRIVEKLQGKPSIINFEKYDFDSYPIISKEINRFIEKYIHRTIVDSPNSLNESDFDVLVVGSDQVWRKKYYPDIKNAYFDFAKDWKNVKRVSYAPSFGTDSWEYSESETNTCSSLIKIFDAISVRELSGVTLCREKFSVTASLVLDPTMLIPREHYEELVLSNTKQSEGEILNYVLDKTPDMVNIVNCIAQERELKTFSVNGKPLQPDYHPENYIKPSIESWLRGFHDAQLVVTDSFHACVFSMIFNKPFVVVGNKTRGMARFESLLSMFGQEFRLIESYKEYLSKKEALMARPNVQNILDSKKRTSLQFLREAL